MAGEAGNKPVFSPDGKYLGPVSKNIMEDARYQPTLREQFALGVGKAHRSVVFSHHEYRNYDRSHLGTTGKL
jgi:hypothetical protein